MPPVLLLVVADLVVELLQVILQSHDFVFGSSNRVVKTKDVFVTLRADFSLVSDAVLCGFYLKLHALDGVL